MLIHVDTCTIKIKKVNAVVSVCSLSAGDQESVQTVSRGAEGREVHTCPPVPVLLLGGKTEP